MEGILKYLKLMTTKINKLKPNWNGTRTELEMNGNFDSK